MPFGTFKASSNNRPPPFKEVPGSDRLHKLVESYSDVDAMDRKNAIAFLEQSGDYVPQSG